ncbi:hypothetical protein [Trinickia symbiotica]|uniref:hypothetical protein n=1 Tax=Trinickia symbiotica TaxID=863227 RepID=UPI000A05944F|nr:hypothetical protein [Trinickia symbiotica]
MSDSNSIVVGRSNDSKYVAFGDDCQFGDICGYVLVAVKRSRIPWVLRELDKIKSEFGIPSNTPLHCRVLFGFHQREKAGLGHLTREAAQSIAIRCLLLLNNACIHVKFASASLSQFASTMGTTIDLWDQQQEARTDLTVHHDPKGLISMLAQMCMMIPWSERRLSNVRDLEIVVSMDKTQAKLFGDCSRQAHHLINAFSDIGAPTGGVFQFTPRVGTEATDPLLQLADVAVYALCHRLDRGEKALFWRTQLPSVRLLQELPYIPINRLKST